MNPKKLSIIIPVWNEKNTIREILAKVSTLTIPGWTIEIIIVDDNSTDGTRDILKEYVSIHKVIYHTHNQGKGTAVKTGLSHATGDYMIIQDADLEYDPHDIAKLVSATTHTDKLAIYGSRNLDPKTKKGDVIPRLGVWFMTQEFNLLYGTHLTDIWTCYKLFPKTSAKYFTAGRFESELSFAAQLIKHGFKIREVPINYYPRPFGAGKKITYVDGIKGILTILQERFTQ